MRAEEGLAPSTGFGMSFSFVFLRSDEVQSWSKELLTKLSVRCFGLAMPNE